MIELRIKELASSVGVSHTASDKQSSNKRREMCFGSDLRGELFLNRFDNPAQKRKLLSG